MRPASRHLLQSIGLPALLISNLTNIRYLSGVSVSHGFVLALPSSYVLFVDDRYIEFARETALNGCRVRPLKSLTGAFKRIERCGFEADHVTVSRLASWKRTFLNTKFVQTVDAIEEYRRSKDERERRAMRKAHAITVRILEHIPSFLKPGVTEREVAWMIESYARERGAEGMAFDSIVAFGANTSRPHHHPSDKKLKKGDIVQIDIGAKYAGYCSDRSAVYFTGKPTDRQRLAYDALNETKDAVVRAIKTGASVRELDGVARSVLKKHKLERYFTHALGHGVGIDIHEGVTLSSKAKDRPLLAHEVVTVEPGVYFPGKWGMRLEDMVFVE